MKKPLKIAILALVVGIIIFFIKYLAYYLTGSVALYSDALESVVNIIAAIAVIFAVKYSAKPADSKHQFGHHKAEYLSASIESIMIAVTGVLIMYEAYEAYYHPRVIDIPFMGLAINAVGTIMNCVLAITLIRYGKKYRSPAIRADGEHLFSDVYSSFGVAIGVSIAVLSGWLILDVIIAFVVGAHIFYTGAKLLKESVDGLMDAAPIEHETDRISQIIQANLKGAIETHDLKIRRAGWAIFIDFHLVVKGTMTVKRSHDICDKIENAILKEFDYAQITIHVEPEYKAKKAKAKQQ